MYRARLYRPVHGGSSVRRCVSAVAPCSPIYHELATVSVGRLVAPLNTVCQGFHAACVGEAQEPSQFALSHHFIMPRSRH